MNDGKKPTLITPGSQPVNPLQTPGIKGSPENPPGSPAPLNQLPPQKGPGAKPWIIMGILVLLIGGAVGLLTVLKGKEDGTTSEKTEDKKVVTKTKKRPSVKTDPRPLKKDMPRLSSTNQDEFKKHESEWVILTGLVETGGDDGLLTFKKPDGFKAQLVKGTGKYITGKFVKVIGWLIDDMTLQIDGIQDVETVDKAALLPKKDVYTKADFKQLSFFRDEKVVFEGTVKKMRSSGDGASFYLVFKTKKGEIFGVARKEDLKENNISEEDLKALVDQKIRLTGKVRFKKNHKGGRLSLRFYQTDDFKVLE